MKKDAPKSNTEAGYYAWCRKWFMKIEDLTYSYYNEPNPESYHIDEQEEVAEDKYDIALKHVKKYKSRLPRLYGGNPEMFMMLKLYKTIGQDPMKLPREEYRAWAKAICDACESVFGSAQEQEEQEDYGMNDLRKWRDSLDFSNNNDDDDEETYTAYNDTDGIWLIINLMRKQGMLRAQGIEGRDDVDDGHAIDKAYDLIEQKLDDEGMWIGDDDHEAERFVSFFGEEIAAEAMKSTIHNQQSQEQEENSLDTEYFSDLEEQEAYYENFRAIAELVADQIDRENGKDIDNNMDTLFEIIREVWNNNPDDLYIWDFDDVQEKDCYKFFDKYYETIKNEYLKREHNNIMDALHGDLFDFSEQEELPQMERHDMILALAEDMAESWIDTGDDGDIDDIYYAIADILDKTGDYPQSTDWKDCKPWCQKYYKEVEARIQ